MSAYVLGFLVITCFTALVGIAALIFVSFDAPATQTPPFTELPTVQRISTDVIETVDEHGQTQRWLRQAS